MSDDRFTKHHKLDRIIASQAAIIMKLDAVLAILRAPTRIKLDIPGAVRTPQRPPEANGP